MIIGTETIIEWFDENSTTPYYSVWNGKQKKFCWTSDNKQKGKEFLEKNLQICEDAGFTDVLTLRLNTELTGKDINERTPYNIEIEFACAGSGMMGASNNQLNQQFYRENFNTKADKMLEAIAKLAENQAALQSQITALTMPELPGEEVEEEDNSFNGIMKSYLKEPAKFQNLIGSVHTVLKMIKGEDMQLGQIAGPGATQTVNATDEQLLKDAITRLRVHNSQLGADLQILAAVAEQKPQLFNNILSQLRLMKE